MPICDLSALVNKLVPPDFAFRYRIRIWSFPYDSQAVIKPNVLLRQSEKEYRLGLVVQPTNLYILPIFKWLKFWVNISCSDIFFLFRNVAKNRWGRVCIWEGFHWVWSYFPAVLGFYNSKTDFGDLSTWTPPLNTPMRLFIREQPPLACNHRMHYLC